MTTTTESTCPTCTHADKHGWWGPGHAGTHCRGCHRSWTSKAQAHCTICHGHFVTDGVAELHWRGYTHLDPADAGLHLGPDAIWSTSATRDPSATAARLAAAREARAA